VDLAIALPVRLAGSQQLIAKNDQFAGQCDPGNARPPAFGQALIEGAHRWTEAHRSQRHADHGLTQVGRAFPGDRPMAHHLVTDEHLRGQASPAGNLMPIPEALHLAQFCSYGDGGDQTHTR